GAAALENEERFAVVLRARDLDTELLLLVQLAQEALGSGARGDDRVLSLQVGEVLDAAVLACEQTGTHDENRIGERDLLLPLEVVGRRAALDVHRAVLHQRDAVLRSDRDELHLQVRELQLALRRVDDAQRDLLRVTDDLLLVVIIGEGDRRLAVPHRDDAALLDLLQSAGQLLRRRRERNDAEEQGDRETAAVHGASA